MLKFRLLGAVEVLSNEKIISLAAPRYEIALSLLLLDANRVVSIDRMIDALWSDKPPRTARRQVQIIVSGLRRLLPEAEIVTRPPGYLIRLADEDLDLACFERLVARGTREKAEKRIDEAIRLLRSALALWRGEAMEGIQSPAIRVAAARLNERRMLALQECLDLELWSGGHLAAIGELTKLVAEHPMDEQFRGQLMLALYWAGRQADALDVFRAGREIMKDELGLEPSSSLRTIERAIITGDKQIEPPASRHLSGFTEKAEVAQITHQLPRATPDFSGREEILAEIVRIIADPEAPDTYPRIVMLTGRGGTGKTALAVRAAHMLSQHFPDGQIFLQVHPGMGQNEADPLEKLLQSLGIRAELIPANLEDRAAMYRSWLAMRRVLIVIDGATHNRQIAPLLPGTAGCAAIITSTHRITGLEGVHQIDVGPLDERSGISLLATVIGANRVAAEQAAALELVRLCDGLPLALRIMAAKLNVRPHWRISTMVIQLRDETRRLDEFDLDDRSVRATLTLAYESLDEATQLLLRRLSLIGTRDFASWVTVPLLDQDISIAENLLQNLADALLVLASVAEDGTVRFHLHDLVRIYATERRVADEDPGTKQFDPMRRLLRCWLYLATRAHRMIHGGDYTLLHGTTEHMPLPAHITDELLRDPARWFESERASLMSAAFRAAELGMDELGWDLVVTAVALRAPGLHSDNWQDPHEAALAAVRRANNKRGEAALLYSLGILEMGVNLMTAAGYFEQSLAKFNEVGDVQGRALALTGLAQVSRLDGNHTTALQYNQEALECFRDTGDLLSEAHTLTAIALNNTDQQEYDSAELMLDEALAALRRLGTDTLGATRLIAQIQHALAELQLQRDRWELAVISFMSALHLAREINDAISEGHALVGLGMAKCALGDFAGAEAALHGAMDLANSTGHRLIRGCSLVAFATLCHAKRSDSNAQSAIDEAIRDFRELGVRGPWQARALALRISISRGASSRSANFPKWLVGTGRTAYIF